MRAGAVPLEMLPYGPENARPLTAPKIYRDGLKIRPEKEETTL